MGIRVNGMDSWRRIRPSLLFIVIYMELGSDYYPPVTGTILYKYREHPTDSVFWT